MFVGFVPSSKIVRPLIFSCYPRLRLIFNIHIHLHGVISYILIFNLRRKKVQTKRGKWSKKMNTNSPQNKYVIAIFFFFLFGRFTEHHFDQNIDIYKFKNIHCHSTKQVHFYLTYWKKKGYSIFF